MYCHVCILWTHGPLYILQFELSSEYVWVLIYNVLNVGIIYIFYPFLGVLSVNKNPNQ